MLSIEIRNIINTIVEHDLLSAGREKEALHFHFDLSLSYYRHENVYEVRQALHLLYHCLPGMRYVSVFSGMNSSPFASLREVKEWKHDVSHDSCWRDINTFSRVYFDMSDRINAALVKDGHLEMAPREMYEHNRLHKYGFVPVKITKVMQDGSNYQRTVELL